MNVNPISFQASYRIKGEYANMAADKITDMIRCPSIAKNSNEPAESYFLTALHTDPLGECANSMTFSNKDEAFVFTGKEYLQVRKLYDDMAKSISCARRNGASQEYIQILLDSEFDRFRDLSRMILDNEDTKTVHVGYDIGDAKIRSFSIEA